MSLPYAPSAYSQSDENTARAEMQRELDRRHRRGIDIELASDRLILRSPNGSRFALAVSNAGVLSAVAL
jgi:hypothetical protein